MLMYSCFLKLLLANWIDLNSHCSIWDTRNRIWGTCMQGKYLTRCIISFQTLFGPWSLSLTTCSVLDSNSMPWHFMYDFHCTTLGISWRLTKGYMAFDRETVVYNTQQTSGSSVSSSVKQFHFLRQQLFTKIKLISPCFFNMFS